jgi:diazepam-binding inhibitor (GABA receptor modulator, acyl-CoA-binding protein)
MLGDSHSQGGSDTPCKSRPSGTNIGRSTPHSGGPTPKETRKMSVKKFEAAVAASKNLSERPDNATLLKLYALYKQATDGDNETKKPGMMDMVGKAKWSAWDELKGTTKADAMKEYIELIESLQ